jgi:DUF4097 and DUF4098 domain-containing protein YvlB
MALTASSRASLTASALAIVISGSGCVDIVANDSFRYVEREEARFAVSGRPEVTLTTFNGSIEVRPWDRAEVLVEVEKHANSKDAAADIEVRTHQDGNRVTIETRLRHLDRHFSFGIGRSARLIVSVPASSDVLATSGDGSIDIERVGGRIELRSGDGSIRGRELSGDVSVHTGDGSIRIEDIDGALNLGTGDGNILASGRISGLRARTGDGRLTIRATPGSAAEDDWSISTGDGSISLELPDDFNAELDAHTGDGRVEVRGGLSDTVESTRRTARGTLGTGGHSVRVRSGDGSITVRRS